MAAPNIAAVRRRFEEHERRQRAHQLNPGNDPDTYADRVTQARWEFWCAAQPGPLDLSSTRAYLDTLKARSVLSTPRTAILKAAQHLMRCIRNDNPEYF